MSNKRCCVIIFKVLDFYASEVQQIEQRISNPLTVWRNKYFSGKKHFNWKGGEHVSYRKLLLKKGDIPKCVICGIQDKRILVVHHKDKNHINHKVDNLMWLCINCHYLVHNYDEKIK